MRPDNSMPGMAHNVGAAVSAGNTGAAETTGLMPMPAISMGA